MDETIFEIPIYTCSPDEYLEARETRKKYHFDYFRHCNRWMSDEEANETAEKQAEDTINGEWLPWRINQIVGSIKIFVFGHQIRGELYFTKKKRIRLDSKDRQIVYYGKAFELHTIHRKTNKEIFEALLKRLEEIQAENRFKNRYIDLEALKGSGPRF